MCTEQSKPIIELNAVSNPIIYAVPIVGQLPPLLNCVNATFAEFRGARTQSGITMAKRPMTWRSRMNPSISGSFFAKDVLKTMQKRTTAMISSVPCHACGVYDGWLRVTKPWMIVPATNESPTTEPCQPIASSHPVDALELSQICFTRNHTRDVA